MKRLIILVWPSGSWKDTIKKDIEENFNFHNLISTTTRAIRYWETNKENYNFITLEEFNFLKENDGFIEYSKYNNNYYGKQTTDLMNLIHKNRNIITILEKNWVLSLLKYKSFFEEYWYKMDIVFLEVSKNIKKERMEKRWDNIKNIEQRILLDEKHFTNMENIANIVINVDWDKSMNFKKIKEELNL